MCYLILYTYLVFNFDFWLFICVAKYGNVNLSNMRKLININDALKKTLCYSDVLIYHNRFHHTLQVTVFFNWCLSLAVCISKQFWIQQSTKRVFLSDKLSTVKLLYNESRYTTFFCIKNILQIIVPRRNLLHLKTTIPRSILSVTNLRWKMYSHNYYWNYPFRVWMKSLLATMYKCVLLL